METHLKLHATQLKHKHTLYMILMDTQIRNMKATIVNKNEDINVIISDPNITPEK